MPFRGRSFHATAKALKSQPATSSPRQLRVTLFTRENCSLCADAAAVLANAHRIKPFKLETIDVMQKHNANWLVYEYDVPVIHIDFLGSEQPTLLNATKLMHRFKEEQVLQLLNEIQEGGPEELPT